VTGTDFPENVKLQARRLAFFKCCYCHDRPGDDVHHLIPKEEGGPGELDNAILLCVQCHADYGHRSEKRAQLRQARDHWQSNVQEMSNQLRFLTETIIGRFEAGSTGTSDVVNIASTMISSIVAPPSGGVSYRGFPADVKIGKKSTEE
jgi:HNH endonuclease